MIGTPSEVTGDWRKLWNEKVHDRHSLPNISRVIKPRSISWVRNVARMGERTGAGRDVAGEPEGKKPLGRPRRIREAGLIMCVQELGWEHGMDSSGSGLGGVAGCCEHGDELSDTIQCNLTR